MVDRYSAYKAMSWVKQGFVVLAFCWAHVRRDFIRVGKGWPQSKTWALEWLRRIRVLYRLNRRRLAAENGSAAFREADGCLRQAVAEMKAQMETELARADLATPCRKALESLREHWEGLTRFVDDPRIPMDNNASERRARGPAVARKNFYGSGSKWSGQLAAAAFSIFATLSMWQAQSAEMADVVLRAMRGRRGQGSRGHPGVLALEPQRREEEGTEGHRPAGRRRHLLNPVSPESRGRQSSMTSRERMTRLDARTG